MGDFYQESILQIPLHLLEFIFADLTFLSHGFSSLEPHS